MSNKLASVLTELEATIALRAKDGGEASYTAKLLSGDEDTLLKKIVEEAGEVALAGKDAGAEKMTAELADLLFHCLVAMNRYNITLDDVAAVLMSRQGVSGLLEKASRKS